MHKLKKLITLSCALALITSILPMQLLNVSAAAEFRTETIIECEQTVSGTNATVSNDQSASGGKYVIASGAKITDYTTITTSDMEFSVIIPEDGNYNVFARVIVKDDGCDSFFYKWGNNPWKDVHLGTLGEQYTWVKLASSFLSKGVSNFSWNHREPSAIYDCFYVTQDAYVSDSIISLSGVSSGTPEALSQPTQQTSSTQSSGNSKVETFPSRYPTPSITPPPEHPRVWFRESDKETIFKNMELDYCQTAKMIYQNRSKEAFDGNMPPASGSNGNFDSYKFDIIQSKALKYALTGDKAMATEAISAIKNALKTVDFGQKQDNTRQMGQAIRVAGMVYDWCYPCLTKEDKEDIVASCQKIGPGMEIGYPPSGQGAVTGHGSEAQLLKDWLCLAIACYDEYPSIYNFVAGRILSEYIAPREYFDAASGSQHQGSAYGQGRYQASLEAQWLFYRMSGQKIFSDAFGTVPYYFLYTKRPDGQLLRDGDDYAEEIAKGTYWKDHATALYSAAAFYNNPYYLEEGLMQSTSVQDFILMLILNNPDLKPQREKLLPLSRYFASPRGMYVARTGWSEGYDSPDVVCEMKIGETWAANHHHLDFGSFQIYYKGILASESGFYESYFSDHDMNYNKQTIAHNSLLIYDPNEPTYGNIINSGGQRTAGGEVATQAQWMQGDKYNYGKVIAHEAGPNLQAPEYTYISGDITKAYTSKVSEVMRSMIFLPRADKDVPAVFMVMDKVTSANPSFKKTWLLHSQQEPEINGKTQIIKRDTDGYNGMLTNQTLLPKNAQITKIGGPGKEYEINGINHPTINPINTANCIEAGWGRIEVTPSGEQNTDYFLNVMYVSDADKTLPVQNAQLIETQNFAGALVLDRAVIFAKNQDNTDETIEFNIPNTGKALNVAVAGIKPGTWEIYNNGNLLGTQTASTSGRIIYFGGNSGNYTLKYKSSNSSKTIAEGEVPTSSGIKIKVKGIYLYTDVEPIIIDDRTLLPARAIFEAIGATVDYDENTETATAVKNGKTIIIAKDSNEAYVDGEKVILDVPAKIINDRFVVPVRFVSEAFNCKVEWFDTPQIVSVSNVK